MVEKITINPTKVRGYGNIINQHSATDYTNYACTLTEETDTINGQTMPVYEMEDTILFWDKAITGMKNTDWLNYSSRLTITTDENGTLLSKGSSNGYYFVENGTYVFTDWVVEFDVIDITGQAAWYVQSQNPTATQWIINLASSSIDCNGKHVKLVYGDGFFNCYVDGVKKTNDIALTVGTPMEMGFSILASTTETRYIKYKNLKVYTYNSPYLFVDYGVTANHNDDMQLYQGVRTITDTGTLIETDINNKWDIRPNNFGLFDTPFNVEFDVVDTSNRLAIYLYDNNTAVIGQWDSGATLQSGDKIKVEVEDNNAKFYVNDVLQTTKNYTSTSKVKLRAFYNVAGNYLKYKNFKIYR